MDQLKETAASVVDEAPVKSRSPSPDTAGKPADPVEEAAPDLNGDKQSSETAAVSSEETKADSSESVDEDAAMTEPSETEDEAGSAEVKELDEVGFAPDEETERAADVEMRLASDVEAKLTSEVEAKLAANLELKLAARVEAKADDVNAVKANTVVSGEVASEDSALVKLLKESAPAKTPPSRGRKRKATSDAAGADENVKKIENMDGVKVKSEDESATDSSSDIKDLVPPGHQQLGKGKRARVPNKRYNDIVPNRASYETSPRPKPLPENGQLTDNEAFIKEELEDELTRRQKKTPKQNLDLTNPNFLKPFKYGWKRELVYRATVDPSQRRNGDIYYYTPSGKKVRSMRELAEQLNDKYLCLEDFTFFKEPLGVNDPEKELIRDAKYKLGVPTALQTALKKACAVSPKSKPSSQVNSPEMPGTSAAATPSINAAATAVAAAANDSSSETKTGKRGRGLKVKMPPLIVKQKEKKQKIEPTEDERLDIAFAANWATTTPSKRGRGRAPRSAPVDVKPKPKVSPVKPPAPVVPDKPVEPVRFMDNYMQNISFGYKTLLNVFQYLKVQDLLRAGCVCSMWCDVSRHQSLWSTVRMKNSQIHSFEGMANALQKHGTAHLDLRKMLLPPSGGENIWPSFTRAIAKVDCLRKIELCRCLASVVEDLATNNHKLEAINAVTIKCDAMSFDPLKNLTNLTDLRLKSIVGLTLTSDLSALRELKKLRHLSITSIRSMKRLNIEVIAELVNLEVLDLGECTDFPKHFGPDILCKLTKLEKLRLEKGQGDCHTFDILESVKKLSNLYQLELVNFDIKTDFDKALGGCINIRKLLIIPTYISQSATTNHMVLGGVLRLQKTLTHFVWGVTLELLRVTELFVDQCENPDKKEMSKDRSSSPGDSIPVLKPVPLHGVFPPDSPAPSDTPQVEILPLPNLQKLLLQNLPTTRVKILKVPFHATWRQSITDSVN